MEEMVKEEVKEQKVSKSFTWYLVQALLFVAIISIGLFAVNQALEYRYRAEFLKAPCELCKELNKNQTTCIDNCFKWELHLYPSASGDWVDNKGDCYDFAGKLIECREGGREKINNTLDWGNLIIPISP